MLQATRALGPKGVRVAYRLDGSRRTVQSESSRRSRARTIPTTKVPARQ